MHNKDVMHGLKLLKNVQTRVRNALSNAARPASVACCAVNRG